MKTLEIKSIEEVYKKVTQQFLFNIYAISKQVDVFIAFETINNRGKPLSHLELLKNRLIYLSTKFDVEEYEKTNLRSAINECCKSIYHYLGKNKNRPLDDDFFLTNHFLLYFARNLSADDEHSGRPHRMIRRLFSDEYKDYLLEEYFNAKNIGKDTCTSEKRDPLTTKEIYRYSQDLKQSVELWYQILNPADSDFRADEKQWLEKLNRLGIGDVRLPIGHATPLVLAFFQKENKPSARLTLLEIIEQFLFIRYMVRYKAGYIDFDIHVLVKYASRISIGQTDTEKVLKELLAVVDSAKANRDLWVQIEKNFRNGGFYEWRGLKYFLYEYDLSLRLKSKTNRDKIVWESFVEDSDDHHTVEHIYPQRPRKACWQEAFASFNVDGRSKLRHSLGNLVPLPREKNSSFQNKCFEDKKGNEENKVGFRYGFYAENEIAVKDSWTAQEILERGIKLLTF